ncbi:MAG: DGQHR domain-containing protein [Vibrio sp.]|uniref:DGQHR domain-containing protein n=1 Tax=Vibrio sp. TaxID=678 RepID=UPI003A84DA09
MDNFLEEKAIYVSQPYSDFYIASIPVSKLVEVCYSFPAVFGNESLNGVQRGINEKRVRDISSFALTQNALFPNAIILSANVLSNGELADEEKCWYINDNDYLIVPTKDKCASIVDGQHRLAGLQQALESGKLDENFRVVCAIYMELMPPQQAEIFATINFNQQKVDKSLAYQLFGYDLDSTDREFWAPDTLAIYISRLLNKEPDSPFYDRINFGMKKYQYSDVDVDWFISTSTIVEGICRLISKNPTTDRYKIHEKKLIKNRRVDLELGNNSPPLRYLYLNKKDAAIYEVINSFFNYLKENVWSINTSFMYKTIGIQASFDILKLLLVKFDNDTSLVLMEISKINIQELAKLTVNYSGIGRGQIRDEIKQQLGL